MKLSKDQQDMLNGNKGRGAQKAMEILTAYGDCFDAEKMVPITSVHFAGNFSVMMDEGIEWLEELALEGARVSVFTTKNSELYDFEQAEELKIPLIYQERQKRIDAAIKALGIVPTYTCHHYLVGNVPRFGDHIAWA